MGRPVLVRWGWGCRIGTQTRNLNSCAVGWTLGGTLARNSTRCGAAKSNPPTRKRQSCKSSEPAMTPSTYRLRPRPPVWSSSRHGLPKCGRRTRADDASIGGGARSAGFSHGTAMEVLHHRGHRVAALGRAVMVPGERGTHAYSVVERKVFNRMAEAEWRSQLQAFSDEELRALDPEDFWGALLDRAERMKHTKGMTRAPTLQHKVEPEYSEEARKAKLQGTVVLSLSVNTDGKAEDIKVLRGLGMGLDEKAI